MKIIYQQITADNKFILGLEGLSSETKPTGDLIADGSSFKETNTDAIYILDTTWKLAKAGQLKELPSVSAGDNGKIMKVADGAWGLGNDSGLPADFPEAGLTNAGKFVGFNDSTGAFEAKTAPSGGGAEKFVVTLTQDAQTEEWTADKTVAEIVAANEANQVVVAAFQFGDYPSQLPLVTALDSAEMSGVIFNGVVGADQNIMTLAVAGVNSGSGDAWQVANVTPMPVPSGTSDGDILVWDNEHDEWDAVQNPYAPLIITLTQDQNDSDTYNGDKTFSEVYNAYIAGRKVLYSLTIGTITKYGDVFYAYRDTNEPSEEYKLTIYLNGDNVNGSGAANDNVSFTEK